MSTLKRIGIMALLSLSPLALSVAHAGDVEDGKQLYDKNCMGCHDTRIHTRPNRIIHTYGDLVNRVKFCDAQVKAGFSEQQIKAVAEYLNKNFYKFTEK